MENSYSSLIQLYSTGIVIILFVSAVIFFYTKKFNFVIKSQIVIPIFYLSLIFYIFSVLSLSFLKIQALNYYADHATHLEIMWRFNNNLGLTSLMSEGYHNNIHWFSAHFTPIIFIAYIPYFYFFPYSETLFILETLYLASTSIPLFLISKKYLSINQSYLISTIFLFYPSIYYINIYGPAYLELAIPLITWLIYFYEKKHLKTFFLLLIICLSIREEVSLVISFFGLFIIFKKEYFIGSVVFTVSIFYFLIVFFFIIPYFNGHVFALNSSVYLGWGGDSPFAKIISILKNPLLALQYIEITRLGNIVLYLIPLLFSSLLYLPSLLITLPNVIITFLSESITHYSFTLYYLAPSIPFIFYSSIIGINNLKFNNKLKNSLIYSILSASLLSTIFFSASPLSIQFWNNDYKVGNFYTSNYHLSEYIVNQNDITAREFSKLVPLKSSISTEQHLLPLFFKSKKMLVYPTIDETTEYILIDTFKKSKSGWDQTFLEFRNNPGKFYNDLEKNHNWELLHSKDGIKLYKRKHGT